MSDIGLYAELHFVLFITFDKGLYHMLVLTTLLQHGKNDWIGCLLCMNII
jgi:hypothetical protein